MHCAWATSLAKIQSSLPKPKPPPPLANQKRREKWTTKQHKIVSLLLFRRWRAKNSHSRRENKPERRSKCSQIVCSAVRQPGATRSVRIGVGDRVDNESSAKGEFLHATWFIHRVATAKWKIGLKIDSCERHLHQPRYLDFYRDEFQLHQTIRGSFFVTSKELTDDLDTVFLCFFCITKWALGQCVL